MSNKTPVRILLTCGIAIIVILIVAYFEPWEERTYRLSIIVNPPKAGSAWTPGMEYESGSNVTVTASPASGYAFDHWGGDIAGTSNPVIVTMDRDKIITAYFKVQYTLVTLESPPSGGTISPAGRTYDPDTSVTLTATPREEDYYIFEEWSGDASGYNRSITITMDKSKIVDAIFVPWDDVYSQVCNGIGVDNAVAYGVTEGIHPAVFLTSWEDGPWERGIRQWSGDIPTEYVAKAVAETECVVCLRMSSEFAASCGQYYHEEIPIWEVEVKAYRVRADIELREARTARIIANTTIYSNVPGCPDRAPSIELYGGFYWNQIDGWLRAYIQ